MPRPDHEDLGDERAEGTRWQRWSGAVSNFALKPAVAAENGTGKRSPVDELTTVPELEAAVRRTSDKERLVGLLIAPVAAGIGFLVTAALVANDPKVPSPHHVNPSQYTELGMVTLALALVMLGTAWLRKRTLFGIATALYGLSMFNLHYWGFGVPFILIGSWYLVRAYRLQEKLKRARAEDPSGSGPSTRPSPSKRYTPPAAQPQRASKPKPAKGTRTG